MCKRGFRFMVHHHHYNQRPFSSQPPQGFFQLYYYYNITPFFPFLAYVFLCVCVWLHVHMYVCIPFQVYTTSRVNTRRPLVNFGIRSHSCKHTHGDHGDRTVSAFRSLAGSDEMELTCWPAGFLGLLDRNVNITPKCFI